MIPTYTRSIAGNDGIQLDLILPGSTGLVVVGLDEGGAGNRAVGSVTRDDLLAAVLDVCGITREQIAKAIDDEDAGCLNAPEYADAVWRILTGEDTK